MKKYIKKMMISVAVVIMGLGFAAGVMTPANAGCTTQTEFENKMANRGLTYVLEISNAVNAQKVLEGVIADIGIDPPADKITAPLIDVVKAVVVPISKEFTSVAFFTDGDCGALQINYKSDVIEKIVRSLSDGS